MPSRAGQFKTSGHGKCFCCNLQISKILVFVQDRNKAVEEMSLVNAMLSVALAYITLITLTDVMTAPY